MSQRASSRITEGRWKEDARERVTEAARGKQARMVDGLVAA